MPLLLLTIISGFVVAATAGPTFAPVVNFMKTVKRYSSNSCAEADLVEIEQVGILKDQCFDYGSYYMSFCFYQPSATTAYGFSKCDYAKSDTETSCFMSEPTLGYGQSLVTIGECVDVGNGFFAKYAFEESFTGFGVVEGDESTYPWSSYGPGQLQMAFFNDNNENNNPNNMRDACDLSITKLSSWTLKLEGAPSCVYEGKDGKTDEDLYRYFECDSTNQKNYWYYTFDNNCSEGSANYNESYFETPGFEGLRYCSSGYKNDDRVGYGNDDFSGDDIYDNYQYADDDYQGVFSECCTSDVSKCFSYYHPQEKLMRDPFNIVGVPAENWYGGVIGQLDPIPYVTTKEKAKAEHEAFTKRREAKNAEIKKSMQKKKRADGGANAVANVDAVSQDFLDSFDQSNLFWYSLEVIIFVTTTSPDCAQDPLTWDEKPNLAFLERYGHDEYWDHCNTDFNANWMYYLVNDTSYVEVYGNWSGEACTGDFIPIKAENARPTCEANTEFTYGEFKKYSNDPYELLQLLEELMPMARVEMDFGYDANWGRDDEVDPIKERFYSSNAEFSLMCDGTGATEGSVISSAVVFAALKCEEGGNNYHCNAETNRMDYAYIGSNCDSDGIVEYFSSKLMYTCLPGGWHDYDDYDDDFDDDDGFILEATSQCCIENVAACSATSPTALPTTPPSSAPSPAPSVVPSAGPKSATSSSDDTAVIGAVVGGGGGLLLIVLVIFLLTRRSRDAKVEGSGVEMRK